jgi:hypothetical protein
MYENVRKEIARLADELPKGYGTFDAKGQPVIQSDMAALDWYTSAVELLKSRGRKAEKERLRAQLAASTGDDNGGGRLYELAAVLDCGPVKCERGGL